MATAVITVASGGLPVTDVTATKPALGMPVTEAARGIAVTKVSAAVGGLPVTFVWARAAVWGRRWRDYLASRPDRPVGWSGGATIAAGNWGPFVGFGGPNTASGNAFTANFGASAFVGAVPAGFMPGWPATSSILDGYPGAATTGVPLGTTLTASGLITTTAPSQVITAKDISGQVTIAHNNCTLQNSRITNAGFACVSVQDGITGAIIQDCEMNGLSGEGTRGISGGGTFKRNNIHHCEDGIYIRGSNTLIEDNYIHTMDAEPTDPHYDGIVNDGGFGSITIRHNTVINSHVQTSCVMMDNDFGPITTVLVENNYLSGGGYNLYVDGQFSGTDLITGVTVQNNLLGDGGAGVLHSYGGSTAADVYRQFLDPRLLHERRRTADSRHRGVRAVQCHHGRGPTATTAPAFGWRRRWRRPSPPSSGWCFTPASTVAVGRWLPWLSASNPSRPGRDCGTGAGDVWRQHGGIAEMATPRYVVSDWMSPGALTFGIGDRHADRVQPGREGGSAASTGNSNAVSYFGSNAEHDAGEPGLHHHCRGLLRIGEDRDTIG